MRSMNTANKAPRALTFCVAADAYLVGHSDDGMPFTALVYFVQAEAADGRRWNHNARFRSSEREYNDCGEPCFTRDGEKAKAAAERLLARIERAFGRIDLAHWCEARPAYGSDAYCGAEELAYEREVGDGEGELAWVC